MDLQRAGHGEARRSRLRRAEPEGVDVVLAHTGRRVGGTGGVDDEVNLPPRRRRSIIAI